MALPPDQEFLAALAVLLPILIALAIWEMIWKGIAMWKAGRNNQLAWFVCILIFNTVGILPIVYLLWFQKPKAAKPSGTRKAKR